MRQKWIEEKLPDMVRDISDLVRIRSVRENEEECPPFGKGVREAVDAVIEIIKKLGFKYKNYNGYAVEAAIGTGSKVIGAMGHLDVVRGGDGWKTDPFVPEIKGGKIFGRGTVDDKGPVICALYAAKYLADNELIPEDVTLKIIVGADEECFWECADYYRQRADALPEATLVADGNFPIIFCEKGILDFNLSHPCAFRRRGANAYHLYEISGGSGSNMVPSSASCLLSVPNGELEKVKELAARRNIVCEKEGKEIRLHSKGKTTHAMNPEKGFNAISNLVCLLGELTEDEQFNAGKFAKSFYEFIGMDYNGRKAGLYCEDPVSGSLTFNVGTISKAEDKILLDCDVRIPASADSRKFIRKLKTVSENNGFAYEQTDFLEAIRLDPDHSVMKALLGAYQEVTGDTVSKPLAIGGGTYARCLDNAAAFGPIFPGREDRTHEANEFISIEDLKLITEIYIQGLLNLTR